MPQPVIRPPRPGDGPGLAHIWLEGAAEYASLDPAKFRVPVAEGLAEWLEERALTGDPDTFMQVSEQHGAVVGHIWAALQPPDPDSSQQMLRDASMLRLTVHWLGVTAAYRRRGLGSRLLQAAEAWAIARGARAAGFSTFSGAAAAITFYEQRMGYQRQAVFLYKSLG